MNSIFDLFATLSLDDTGFTDSLNDSESKASDFGSKLSKGLGGAVKVAGATLATVGAGVATVTKKMSDGIAQTASYGDNIDKMSQKLGISAEAYQEWDFIAQHAGTSVEGLQTSMKTLSNAVVDGKDSFEALGISLEDAQKMSTEDLFSAVITSLQNMEEGTERTALASDLLGKSATELGALFNMTAEDTEAMRQQAHDLGGVMSDEAVKASADYADSLQNLQTAISGLSKGALSEFIPNITQVMDGLTQIFGGDESGLGQINAGISSFIEKLTENLPKVLEVGTSIVTTLATAVITNLPMIVSSATDIVMSLVNTFVTSLPQIIQIAGEIILTLANGIGASLPDLIPTIVDVVITIVENLIDNVDMLIDSAIEIIMALAEGLINALPKLIEKAPVIIEKLVMALANNAPKLLSSALTLIVTLVKGIITNLPQIIVSAGKIILALIKGIGQYYANLFSIGKEIIDKVKNGIHEKLADAKTWGKDLLDNFIAGIKEKIEKLKETVSNVAQTVKDFLGFSEPKAGPLSNFHTYAPDMMDLFAKGIKDNEDTITDQIEDSFDFGNSLGDFGAVSVKASASSQYDLVNAFKEALSDLHISASIDGDDVFNSMKSKAKNYQAMTGKKAFA